MKNVLESLKESVKSGKITIREAAQKWIGTWMRK